MQALVERFLEVKNYEDPIDSFTRDMTSDAVTITFKDSKCKLLELASKYNCLITQHTYKCDTKLKVCLPLVKIMLHAGCHTFSCFRLCSYRLSVL